MAILKEFHVSVKNTDFQGNPGCKSSVRSIIPVPECPRRGSIPLMGLTDRWGVLGPHNSRTCRPLGQVPLVLPAGLARGQSKPQLQKARTAFPSALIRLSCNRSHEKAVLAFPRLAECCAKHIKDCPR